MEPCRAQELRMSNEKCCHEKKNPECHYISFYPSVILLSIHPPIQLPIILVGLLLQKMKGGNIFHFLLGESQDILKLKLNIK